MLQYDAPIPSAHYIVTLAWLIHYGITNSSQLIDSVS